MRSKVYVHKCHGYLCVVKTVENFYGGFTNVCESDWENHFFEVSSPVADPYRWEYLGDL